MRFYASREGSAVCQTASAVTFRLRFELPELLPATRRGRENGDVDILEKFRTGFQIVRAAGYEVG